jgi:hypothetical protein
MPTICELALAHIDKDRCKRPQRDELLAERRPMMEDWADCTARPATTWCNPEQGGRV